MNKIFKVETRTGGTIIKTFNLESDAKKYYENNKNFNAIMCTLYPFTFEDNKYYYSIGSNCLGIYNTDFSYITKLKKDIVNIKEELKKYFDNWILPY